MQKNDWSTPYLSLELLGGTLTPLINDDEDMLVIKWSDGMYIDIGFIKEENKYYITTVADKTMESWNNPLSVIEVEKRADLRSVLQKEIIRCRA